MIAGDAFLSLHRDVAMPGEGSATLGRDGAVPPPPVTAVLAAMDSAMGGDYPARRNDGRARNGRVNDHLHAHG